ncbi:hypothetical protein J2T17_004401 [Paenibacillus mucilaginosus]|uniref:YolD-like family protein n=1 Tax=Paenibacillus mucilaginosus TaxID=61624 RepID=UPI003D1EEC3B
MAKQNGERERVRRTRAVLHDTKIRAISEAIEQSFMDRKRITLRVAVDSEDKDYSGVVDKIDQGQNSLRVGGKWIPFETIIGVNQDENSLNQ